MRAYSTATTQRRNAFATPVHLRSDMAFPSRRRAVAIQTHSHYALS